ncbi:MAG: hypothetical protein HY921_08885 [Elusimicrobia bacterium]|nr:hypothetical protein [Elusimicrobiota bacterium]
MTDNAKILLIAAALLNPGCARAEEKAPSLDVRMLKECLEKQAGKIAAPQLAKDQASLAVPADQKLHLRLFGQGQFIDVCKETSPGKFEWTWERQRMALYCGNDSLSGYVAYYYHADGEGVKFRDGTRFAIEDKDAAVAQNAGTKGWQWSKKKLASSSQGESGLPAKNLSFVQQLDFDWDPKDAQRNKVYRDAAGKPMAAACDAANKDKRGYAGYKGLFYFYGPSVAAK